MDLREAIRTQPMRSFQIWVVTICFILAMIDGYEVVAMPFTIPHLAKAWTLSSVEVGYLLSSGIFGMAIGAVVISPLVDRIGRRRHILLCLIMITLGMALSAAAQTVYQLVALRAFAGLFIGAMISSLNIMVSEYSSEKRRGTAMGLYGVGLPLGSALAGLIITYLVGIYGWRAPFVCGALLTGIMSVVVYVSLPESIEFLIEKRPAKALESYNKTAARLGFAPVKVLPLPQSERRMQAAWRETFRGITRVRTIFLWISYAGVIAAFYFANTWTAKLISDASGNPDLGIRAGMLIQFGGVLGTLLFAAIALKIRPRLVTLLILAVGAISFSIYGQQIGHVDRSLLLAPLLGICANGGIAAFYAISPPIYPTVSRGTGVGLMIGFGRAIAILAPIGTGYVLTAGWTPAALYHFFGATLAVSTVFCLLLDRTYRGRSENPETPDAMVESDMLSPRTT